MISETRFGVCLRLREDDGETFHNPVREGLPTNLPEPTLTSADCRRPVEFVNIPRIGLSD